MLIGSMLPLFILLAIKGSNFRTLEYNYYFSNTFWWLAGLPYLLYAFRLLFLPREGVIQRKVEDRSCILDCRDKYSSYILSIVLPICQSELNDYSDFKLFISILFFIIIVFYCFNLYYLNIVFYFFGYKLHEITPVNDEFETFILITKKDKYDITIDKDLPCKKITNGLFLEVKGDS